MDTKVLKELVAYFGSQEKTAIALNIGQSAVSHWLTGRATMSILTAITIEKVTQGKFKAWQFRNELKPDYATAS
jgi:DNA-binding transcriptional regulator YdaS (Cro superfamily)